MGIGAAPPIPVSSALLITVLNVSGAAPPTIGTFTVHILPSAGLRNVPPVCSPSSATSPPLVGGFGPSRIVITNLSAAPPVNCNVSSVFGKASVSDIPLPTAPCDSVYGVGDRLDITFDQNVTLCLGLCR